MKKISNTNLITWLIVGVLFLTTTILVFGTENTSWPAQVLAACLGAAITIIATRLLLNSQSEIDEKNKRDFEIYNAKLGFYSDFVSSMYKAYDDDRITSDEFREIRTKLFSTIFFYAGEDVLRKIRSLMDELFFKTEDKSNYNYDAKMPKFFSGLSEILQNDTIHDKNKNKNEKEDKDIVQDLWNKFNTIIDVLKEQEKDEANLTKKEKQYNKEGKDEQRDKSEQNSIINMENNDKENIQENAIPAGQQYLNQQSWHFNAWGAQQFEQLNEWDKSKENEVYDLSLVEYGEYWRTNLLKQIGKDDVIMLFRRGGYGYVGAFKPVGRRVFDFEKGEEEILYFDDRGRKTVKKDDEQFMKDVEKYDIYGSMEDGATLCSNLIVKCIAYVPEGVGNPGGVYRRTISRYDSHYAWLLKERFQEKGQWK